MRQSANARASVQTPRMSRSAVQSSEALIISGADATAAAIASMPRTIVGSPNHRGITPVSAHIFPIVHHQMPRTSSAATTSSMFADAASPIVTAAVPALVPRIAPLCRTEA